MSRRQPLTTSDVWRALTCRWASALKSLRDQRPQTTASFFLATLLALLGGWIVYRNNGSAWQAVVPAVISFVIAWPFALVFSGFLIAAAESFCSYCYQERAHQITFYHYLWCPYCRTFHPNPRMLSTGGELPDIPQSQLRAEPFYGVGLNTYGRWSEKLAAFETEPLERQADFWEGEAVVRRMLGSLDASLDAFHEALAFRRELVQQEPSDVHRQAALARSLYLGKR